MDYKYTCKKKKYGYFYNFIIEMFFISEMKILKWMNEFSFVDDGDVAFMNISLIVESYLKQQKIFHIKYNFSDKLTNTTISNSRRRRKRLTY